MIEAYVLLDAKGKNRGTYYILPADRESHMPQRAVATTYFKRQHGGKIPSGWEIVYRAEVMDRRFTKLLREAKNDKSAKMRLSPENMKELNRRLGLSRPWWEKVLNLFGVHVHAR
jgi:hypothetical protein